MHTYEKFLADKARLDPPTGLTDIPELPDALFPFQADIVRWALRRGRAALFAGTGLGKSLMELAWGQAIHHVVGRDVLILTPLAVGRQMVREGAKFGIPARFCASQSDVLAGISVTNYQKLGHFDASHFGAVVLDESSILKSLDGKTRETLIRTFHATPFRLAATATPAPNDFMELGNHSQFLGVLSHSEMLSMFFVHDGGSTQKWRLKRHADSDFWKWMASWAVLLRKPEDLGYEDDRFDLPPLNYHEHTVKADHKQANKAGLLFAVEAATMQERLAAKRATINERVDLAAKETPTDKPCVWWCHLNAESEALAKAIPGAVELRGSDSDARKEETLDRFSNGDIRVLITKPSIAGFGLNWQHCADTGFVGLNDSFEQVYQSIRRFWRFGQNNSVNVHFVSSELEGAVVRNIRRKEEQAEQMAESMVRHMADLTSKELRGTVRQNIAYLPQVDMEIPDWLINGRAA